MVQACAAFSRTMPRLDLLTQLGVTPPIPPTPIDSSKIPVKIAIHSDGILVDVGKTLQLSTEVRNNKDSIITVPVSWSVDSTTLASISTTGLLTGKKGGIVITTASASATVIASRSYTVKDTVVTPPIPPIPPDSNPPVTTDSFPILVYNGIKAELPRVVLKPGYPTGLTKVYVPLIGNLQFYLDNNCGKEIILPVGSIYAGNFVWRPLTCGQMTLVRTDTTTSWTRTTPTKAANLRLAKIISSNYSPVLFISQSSSLLWLDLLEITNTSLDANMLIQSDAGRSRATTPQNIHFTRNYIHGTPDMKLRRSIRVDMCNSYIAHNWISENHNNDTDTQAILGINGTCNLNIVDNYLSAAHEVVMFGGGDPADSTMSPHDITLKSNHIIKPIAWKGKWLAKNLNESKNVIRWDIVGNVYEYNWPSAQDAYAFVMKSENQDGTAPYSTSSDITIRWNKITCTANGFNFSGKGSNPTPNVTAARFTVYHNYVPVINVAPCNGDYSAGVPFQLLSGIQDAVIINNTIENNKSQSNAAIKLEGATRLVMSWNVMWNGDYGVKGSGLASGNATFARNAPGAVFTNNTVVGADCPNMPATTNCTSNIPVGAGANIAKLDSLLKGVVVAP